MRRLFLVGLAALSVSSAYGQRAVPTDPETLVLESCNTLDDEQRSEQLLAAIMGFGERVHPPLLRLAASKKPEARCALRHLRMLRDMRVVPIARKILDDPRSSVGLKEEALGVITILKDTASFERVLRIFESRPKGLIRPAAVALGALGDERGLLVLREALADQAIGGLVVSAVGVKGHEAAVAPLLAFLQDNPTYEKYQSLRSDVLISLTRIGTPRSRAAALGLLPTLRDEWFRNSVAEDMQEILYQQREKTQDANEIAEIDALIAQLDTYRSPASRK